jgi:Holliday junction DNA helicase RuvA
LIAYLNGEITLKNPAFIYIECHGVGYHVNISLNTYSRLESLNKVKVLTYLHVKEDEQSLYGFFEEEERTLFIHLISVSGIGVNTARVILSYMSPEEVASAILREDEVALSKVKGIGAKTAKRIILDLKDKLGKTITAEGIKPSSAVSDFPFRQEAISALVALGFTRPVVEKQVKAVLDKSPAIQQVEELIKMALRQMSS